MVSGTFLSLCEQILAIRVFRYSFERAVKLADYSKSKECIKLKMPEPYIILIEEEEGVKDRIKIEIEFSKNVGFTYNIKVLRYWTYGLEQLYKENMYLLYPLQIFSLRKKMKQISKSNRMKKFASLDEDTVKKIKSAKHENLNIIIENILDIESLEEAVRYLT